jgi:apolipoprotein N-acyltransferase
LRFHLQLIAVLLLLFIEARLSDWHKIPFTCSYVPGRRNFWQIMGVYLLLFAILIPTITFFEARLLRSVILLVSTAALSVIYFSVRSTRQTQWATVPLLFDESDEPPVGGVRLTLE